MTLTRCLRYLRLLWALLTAVSGMLQEMNWARMVPVAVFSALVKWLENHNSVSLLYWLADGQNRLVMYWLLDWLKQRRQWLLNWLQWL